MITSTMTHPLAVVPIFVNAGTALLPAILAGIVSVVALLFKPRELVRVCRRRPVVPVVLLVVVAGFWGGSKWLWGGSRWTAAPRPNQADWSKIALAVLRRQDASVRILTPKWDYNPDDAWVLSSPRVIGNRVYAATAFQDITKETFGAIFCLDATNGQPLWRTDDADGPLKPFFSSPALTADSKYLVIGQGLHFDADCDLLCFEAATGRLHWRIPTPLHIESSPAIHGDLAVAGAGAIEDDNHKPKSHPGLVLAVRISDGKELWRYPLSDPESSPAISPDGIVFIGSGFQGNAVVALRSETDEELKQKGLDRLLWRTAMPYPMTGAVTLVGDRVYVGGGNGDYVTSASQPAGVVAALDARTGQVLWRTAVPDSALGKIAVGDNLLVVPVCNGEVLALNPQDGAILWRHRISGKSPIAAGPALAKGYVYAVSKDGYLAVLDAKDGKLLERHSVNAEGKPGETGLSLSSPTVAGGRIFVGSETGGLRCFAGGKVTE